ncbi:hypothetical protein HanRHA438_Chr10g0461071 [Helianthus annuus]|nr:hypothetical protein HanRHA438_Chr10g0461071 [Helianthus annuus]
MLIQDTRIINLSLPESIVTVRPEFTRMFICRSDYGEPFRPHEFGKKGGYPRYTIA